jgi:hypothetical protein
MSLVLLETRLVPDPRLRLLVQLAGWVLLVIGLMLVICLPLGPAWRGVIGVAWVCDVCRELFNLRTFSTRLHSVRLDQTGHIVADGPDGEDELTLLSGSLVMPRIAWLRLRFADNCRGAELFRGDMDKDPQWQQFQLIWRQSGGAFGRSG